MKGKLLLSLFISLAFACISLAQVPASQDTIFIPGGTLSGGGNEGLMETTINGDTTGSGTRINPNRVYALYEGQVYFQLAPINVDDPTGTLTIVGVPDPSNPSANEKPIIVIVPTNGTPVLINGGGVNVVYGSIKFDNVYYQTMQIDGTLQNELFYCGTKNNLPQKLTIANSVFEFSNIDLFDCTNETGAIGGWPDGASFFITNSYFRNMFYAGQWWGARVFQCKHPIDTLWIENCTVTTGGLTFLQQKELADFVYINHNTIINNDKYWLLGPYRHDEYITNNIFVNQNWVGEDINVTNSGQDPDGLYMSTIDIDTNNISPGGLDSTGGVQPKYLSGGKISSDLDFAHMKVYVSNNVNFYSPQLISGYYKNPTYINDTVGTIPSYLTWSTPAGPKAIGNTPGEWMNSRTAAIFKDWAPPNGGFVEEHTDTTNPNMQTPAIANSNVVTMMAEWNQNQWADPRYPNSPDITGSKYIYGDYLPTTLPGIDNGTKTDNITAGGTGIQVGISKFTDFQENFSQTTDISTIDGLPVGALMWNDQQEASFNSKTDFQEVMTAYQNAVTGTAVKDLPVKGPATFSLSQNYPNPFNPSTTISFSVAKAGIVNLVIYNSLGQKVRTLVNQQLASGNHRVQWDGKDSNGMSVASGIYFYRLSAGSNLVLSKKMILLK